MSYPTYMTPERFEAEVYKIFAAFVVRAGTMSVPEVREEIGFLKDSGIDVTSNMSWQQREELYFCKQRIGASFKMNRKDRKSLMITLENAINHATFSDEIYGNPEKWKIPGNTQVITS